MTNRRSVLGRAFLILLLSRIVGLSREVLVSTAFGFSQITDEFYQASFSVVALQAMVTGPFTTAFAARLATASPSDKAPHVRYYMRLAVWIGASLSTAMLIIAAGLLGYGGVSGSLWLPVAILSPSVICASVTGYIYAVATAFGRIATAALLLFVANAVFVAAIIILWLVGASLRPWTLPAAYSLAAIVGAGFAHRFYIGILAELDSENPTSLGRKAIRGLAFTYGLAGLESAFFLFTQSIVLALASTAGPGWASAISVVQRIALSVLGLIISPIASLLMLRVLQQPETARRQFLRTILSIGFGLAVVGFVLALAGYSIVHLGFASRSPKYASALKVAQLLPSYALWLVPLGVTGTACRVMFGLKLERIYTLATVITYGAANLLRVGVASAFGLSQAIAAGAGVELICAIFLVVFTQFQLIARGGPR